MQGSSQTEVLIPLPVKQLPPIISNSYKVQVKMMIESILRGCLLPQMEPQVLTQHVNDWSETFHGIIPEEYLHRAYMAAKCNPDRSPAEARFPIKDTEVLQAWYRIKAAESVARPSNQCDLCKLHSEQPGRYKKCHFHQIQPVGSEQQLMGTKTA